MGAEFGVLGPLEVYASGRFLALGGLKQRALLALFLLRANEVVPAEQAAEAIWPEADLAAARRNLQVYVSSLRKALGEAGSLLRTTPGGYLLEIEPGDLDATRFERLLREGGEAAAAGFPERASTLFREALELWRGPALADLRYEDFALAEVERLEELRLSAVEQRLEADLAAGRHDELVSELEALVAAHPLRERLRGQLMRALYRSGRQADALAAYREARRTLLEELGLEPGRELAELEAAILRHDPALTVESADVRQRRRLPAPATALVGRRAEVDAVTRNLGGDVRLVTLTGPGGTGKTRVALQSAHELARAFRDGVRFVGLAPLRDPELVPDEIAAALGVEAGPLPARQALVEHLRERALLLVVDNFEQVDAAAPELGELLAAAPELRLLVTSRHPLRLYGEHELPVPPLPEGDAVELFVARARAVKPDFRASAAVAELCAYVDRLPLAIELVAGRVRELSPNEMLDTLPPRLELASRGPRNVPERQQTLWATIGWSHDLLSDDEREAFAQHAVFAGGWTAEAAAEVCAPSPGVAEALLEKNLLLRAGDRLTMLETVREYAVERLDELPDAAAVRRRHAEHMLALVLSGDDVRRTPGEVGWMDRLDLERENLRAAFLFWLDEEPSRAAALAEGSFRFWYARAHFEEGFRAFERLRGRGEALSERQLANVFGRSAAFAFARRDLPLARELVEEALERRRRLDDVDQVARVLVLTGTVRSEQGDHAGALLALEESVELARERGDPFLLNFALAHLLRAAVYAEDYERARAVGDEALRSIRSSGDTGNEFGVLANLGIAALRTRKHREAADRFAAALAVASSLRDPLGMLENIEAIAAVAAAEGLAAPAARLLAGAEALEAARDIRLEAISLAVREDTVAALRVALGEAELREHQRAGGAMALEAAVDEAAALARRLAG